MITNRDLKIQILNKLFSTIELSKYTYSVIQFKTDLKKFLEDAFFIIPNYIGVDSILYFYKDDHKHISCIINKKTLFYDIDRFFLKLQKKEKSLVVYKIKYIIKSHNKYSQKEIERDINIKMRKFKLERCLNVCSI